MTDELRREVTVLPCHDCISATLGPDNRPMLCERVTRAIMRTLEDQCGVDMSNDVRLEAEIAATKLGKYTVANTVAKRACIQVSLPVPPEMMSVLDRIQC